MVIAERVRFTAGRGRKGVGGSPVYRRVMLEDAALIAGALDWTVGGKDFADALHLAKAEGCDAMMTFDRRFARAARSWQHRSQNALTLTGGRRPIGLQAAVSPNLLFLS